ncbi:MAG TPA: carboxypeptidase-like regulatory domain-containing protein [Solirubrobacteraceae bacterium]|jgi:hypothetical protein|nr:carboxypeptidase-like regulatory domain-containing protein [Solirubrobacteraceae bacterium]
MSALAGQYHVYSCRTPDGEVAPVDGWSESATGSYTVTSDTCAKPGGALIAGLIAETTRYANTNMATWAFAAPVGETLVGAKLWRAGDADGGAAIGASYQYWIAAPIEADIFDDCSYLAGCPSGVGEIGEPMSPANQIVEPAANLGPRIYVLASCGGMSEYRCPDNDGDANGYAAVVYLYAANLTLEQSTPPTASNVSGELATAPTLAGTSDVAFSASDPGSGVYEALFSVDGQVVQSTPLDENGGRCKDVGETTDGLPAFLYVQPCLAAVSADVGFDTARVANGPHHLVVTVIDAAGNSATVLDRNVTIDNPVLPGTGAPNGTGATTEAALTVAWKNTSRNLTTSTFDAPHTIVGRLTGAGGAPIGDAQVGILSTPAYAGATTAAMPSVRTGADGRFVLRLPAGLSSRTLRFQYSSSVDAPPVVTRTLSLRVRAGVALRVSPRVVSVGRSIYFTGRLRGGPVPSGGKLLVLEARSPGGAWLEFEVVRSDDRGRFHASYRFKFPGPADYQFRVVCEAEADYPFATGDSKVIGVFER